MRAPRQVGKLCKAWSLPFPSKFSKKNTLYYGHDAADGTLDCVIGITMYTLNKTPGSLCVSIDLAVSANEEHVMSKAVNSIKEIMRKRRNFCMLVTQSAPSDVAKLFWQGRLAINSRASVLTILLYTFDKGNTIYTDTIDMAEVYGDIYD